MSLYVLDLVCFMDVKPSRSKTTFAKQKYLYGKANKLKAI
jgi:hypothetical protein